ncbi:short-chain type dehydrogenase/reductase domain protein [Mycobacterium xenopi 4042]|uniref:Short-chain type dehydrogenase/reductase domain protein n=1 Tax=Mycobacterium xenopi 4042 TaxID=1299334 RepID=X8DKU6_MYCXE|nr:short-chain type dehydrogenase/reductase domain protein [Mycobacterium xenopi 4042]
MPRRVSCWRRCRTTRPRRRRRTEKAAGAKSVELVDFDALDTDSHPAVIEQAFAR